MAFKGLRRKGKKLTKGGKKFAKSAVKGGKKVYKFSKKTMPGVRLFDKGLNKVAKEIARPHVNKAIKEQRKKAIKEMKQELNAIKLLKFE